RTYVRALLGLPVTLQGKLAQTSLRHAPVLPKRRFARLSDVPRRSSRRILAQADPIMPARRNEYEVFERTRPCAKECRVVTRAAGSNSSRLGADAYSKVCPCAGRGPRWNACLDHEIGRASCRDRVWSDEKACT